MWSAISGYWTSPPNAKEQPAVVVTNNISPEEFQGKLNDFVFVGDEVYREELQPMADMYKNLFTPEEEISSDDRWFYFPKIKYHQNHGDLCYIKAKIKQREDDLKLLVEGFEKGKCSRSEYGSSGWTDYTYGPGQRQMRTDSFGMSHYVDMPFSMLLRKTLDCEYTIHLTPKPEHTLKVVDLLLNALHSDLVLRQNIFFFKVARLKEAIPSIVISTIPNLTGGSSFATSTILALDRLFVHFKPCLHLGSGSIPEFSCGGTNGLISYAQGNVNQKIALKRDNPDIFKKIYDETGAHYHPDLQFGYEFSLNLPDGF